LSRKRLQDLFELSHGHEFGQNTVSALIH
jgi:hypothetical protein